MDIVTGAFGYIGRHITSALLERGREVNTITTHPGKPNPFGPAVQAYSYSFEEPGRLTETLVGAETLYNTYWIRFPYDGQTYESALQNTRIIFRCASQAGVKKIIHIGVTQASLDSELPYYHGKAKQELILKESGVPYAVIRPTLVFGQGDILVNNIAWLIRKFPLFPIFGSGHYRVQPVFVEDLAEIAIQHASSSPGLVVDAIGPETFTFDQLVKLIAGKLGRRIRFVSVPPSAGIFIGKLLGVFLRDVILTGDELRGLMTELLTSTQAPNASTRFSKWLEENNSTLGTHYSSEVARHFRWTA